MAQLREALGSLHDVTVHQARIHYHTTGSGPPVVFVHGFLANAVLWHQVVPSVAAAGYRCVTPDWPLGAHTRPVPDADLTPPAVADLIASFLAALELTDVTIVANDTGGALTQILMSRHPDRIGRVVLTPSDSYERFFPPVFAFLPQWARVPGGVWLLTQLLRARPVQRLPVAFGWLAKRPLPRAVVEDCLGPSRRDPAIRADLGRFLRGVDKRHTLAAAGQHPRFRQPVLLAWAREDKHFPLALARRLAKDLPHATLHTIDDSYTFIPHDQPQQLADMIVEFAGEHAAS